MNTKKIIIIILFLSIVAVLSYYSYNYALRPLITVDLYLTPLNSVSDSLERDKIYKDIVDYLGDSPELVKINLYDHDSGNWEFVNQVKLPTGLLEEGTKQRMIKSKLDSIFIDEIDELTLSKMSSMFMLMSDLKPHDEDKLMIVLTGQTPDCLPLNTVHEINESFGKTKQDNISIFWNLKSNTDHPDNLIKTHLDTIVELIDKQIIKTRNTCKDDTLNLDLVLFSKLDKDQLLELKGQILKDNYAYYDVSLTTSNKKFGDIFHISEIQNDFEFDKYILDADQSDTKQSRFSFQYIVEKFKNDSTSQEYDIYLLGTLPYSRQKFVDISPIKGKENLNFYVDLTSTNKYIDPNKIIINAFKANQLNIQKYN